MGDILAELKRVSRCVFNDGWESPGLHARAGVEIAMLRARIAELEGIPPVQHVAGGRPAGHCDDDSAWKQFSDDYGNKIRADLGKGDLTDFALANAQFMCDRNSLDLIVYQTAAKERIRWLSIQLAQALAALKPEGAE